MEKTFDPRAFEEQLYVSWEKSGAFKARDIDSKPPFCIPMPPPNVTGALHNGHALFVTLQDTLARWKRMSGFNTLWLPGTDHAGIATQMVVERELKKEKLNRHQMGREAFLKRVWDWKEKHGEIIVHQMKKLGASPDWTRARFTMDAGMSNAVRKVFVQLYREGLIYKGMRMTSRCTRCETVLSDLEVIATERKSHLWHIRYFSKDKKYQIVIATSRPETLLGDTAVAVNPDDERFTHLHGKKLEIPFVNREVPVIIDSYVDKEFGTGALKVTPAHDFNDYELGKKHKLPFINILEPNGKLNENAGPYKGLTVAEARNKIVEDLKSIGALEKIEDITQQIGLCQRCDSVVEPLISEQWFLNPKSMAEKVVAMAKKGEALSLQEVDRRTDAFKILPENWYSTFYHWMENIREWCISRQLWWGHRIPAWYCEDCKHITVSETDPSSCEKCRCSSLRQDEDVLDTWFSSSLWPFTTLGWPEKTDAYKTFYPASILETGFDILFFWVARMLMMGVHFNDGRVPFKRVYLHAMVRDEKGQKMSKTKGNIIDPLDLIRDYGADAFRFTLLAMSGQGRDIRLSVERLEGYAAFCNKLWNASRYTLMRLGHVDNDGAQPTVDLASLTKGQSLEDWIQRHRSSMHPVNQWMLSAIDQGAMKINQALDSFRMGDAANEIYALTWNSFCDWYIEFSKELLKHEELKEQTLICLAYCLRQVLMLAHPFIPFITEEIFKHVPKVGNDLHTLMKGPFPQPQAPIVVSKVVDTVEVWKEAIEKIRAFRGENGVPLKARPDITYAGSVYDTGIDLIKSVAQLGSLKPEDGSLRGRDDTGEILTKCGTFYVNLRGLVDFEEEIKRLSKQQDKIVSDISSIERRLEKRDFVQRAPKELIESEKARLQILTQALSATKNAVARLQKIK